ncbi:MAG: protoheme IX farnesyltransferase [Candidatus Fraserbacteria bacterium RBG_16_55_9]|uniref:Protoheme IX farnesyltransferase n=1 Tax=Fraserbacteria sp. (strain RBG_16_55_9) TaxID=1817864 RepID=A0A1F5V2L8_FRAXR|nr:MAG: protoheme IX farnesyltransferase [Candidatus Fraserbacteria bacterium RBG_16_55_9]
MQVQALPIRKVFSDYMNLTKPRITFLVLVTTLAGLWLGAHGLPPWEVAFVALVGTGLASASAATLNNYIDRDLDVTMERTRGRPLPSGRLRASEALIFGIALGMASFVILGAFVNLLSALLALLAIFVYVAVYTAWLKRRTPLCTVIGGVSGALPPVIGWAAVANQIDPAALVLFAILFLWQPPHFWALALLRKDEYSEAGLPMLPVVHGPAMTHRQISLYAAALLPVSLMLYPLGVVGWGYLLAAAILGLGFVALSILLRFTSNSTRLTRTLFLYSTLYLAVLSVMMLLDCRG